MYRPSPNVELSSERFPMFWSLNSMTSGGGALENCAKFPKQENKWAWGIICMSFQLWVTFEYLSRSRPIYFLLMKLTARKGIGLNPGVGDYSTILVCPPNIFYNSTPVSPWQEQPYAIKLLDSYQLFG